MIRSSQTCSISPLKLTIYTTDKNEKGEDLAHLFFLGCEKNKERPSAWYGFERAKHIIEDKKKSKKLKKAVLFDNLEANKPVIAVFDPKRNRWYLRNPHSEYAYLIENAIKDQSKQKNRYGMEN